MRALIVVAHTYESALFLTSRRCIEFCRITLSRFSHVVFCSRKTLARLYFTKTTSTVVARLTSLPLGGCRTLCETKMKTAPGGGKDKTPVTMTLSRRSPRVNKSSCGLSWRVKAMMRKTKKRETTCYFLFFVRSLECSHPIILLCIVVPISRVNYWVDFVQFTSRTRNFFLEP